MRYKSLILLYIHLKRNSKDYSSFLLYKLSLQNILYYIIVSYQF